jgi:hypothetical protein
MRQLRGRPGTPKFRPPSAVRPHGPAQRNAGLGEKQGESVLVHREPRGVVAAEATSALVTDVVPHWEVGPRACRHRRRKLFRHRGLLR